MKFFNRKYAGGRSTPTTRRGAILLLDSIIFLVIGIAYLVLSFPHIATLPYVFAVHLMPFPGWGAGFVVVGLIGILSAFSPTPYASIGFSVLSGWITLWASLGAMSAIFDGQPRGWLTALIFGVFAGNLMITSGFGHEAGRRHE